MLSKVTLVAMLSCVALAAPGKDYGAAVANQEGGAAHGGLFGGNAGLGAGARGDHGSLKGYAYSHVSVYRPKTHTVPIYYHHHEQEHKSHGANQAAVLGAHQGNELNEGYALQGYTHQEEAAPAGYGAGPQVSYSAGHHAGHAGAQAGFSAGAQAGFSAGAQAGYSVGHQASYVAAAPEGYAHGGQVNYVAAAPASHGAGEVNYSENAAAYSAGNPEASYHVTAGVPETSGQVEQHYGVAERSGYEQYVPAGHGLSSGQENTHANYGLFRPNVHPQYHY